MVIPTQLIFWINYVNYRHKDKNERYDGAPVEIPEIKYYIKALLLEFDWETTDLIKGKEVQDVDFIEKRKRT